MQEEHAHACVCLMATWGDLMLFRGGIIYLDMAPFQITSNYEIKGAKSHPKKTGFGLEASDHMGMIMVTSNGSGVESQGTRTSPFPRVTEDEALQLSCK